MNLTYQDINTSDNSIVRYWISLVYSIGISDIKAVKWLCFYTTKHYYKFIEAKLGGVNLYKNKSKHLDSIQNP